MFCNFVAKKNCKNKALPYCIINGIRVIRQRKKANKIPKEEVIDVHI